MMKFSEIIFVLDPHHGQIFQKLFEIWIQIMVKYSEFIWDPDACQGQIFKVLKTFIILIYLIEYLRNLETDKLVIFSSILIVFIWMHLMIDYLCFSSKLGQSWSEQFTPGSSSVYTLQSTRFTFIQHFVIHQIVFFTWGSVENYGLFAVKTKCFWF